MSGNFNVNFLNVKYCGRYQCFRGFHHMVHGNVYIAIRHIQIKSIPVDVHYGVAYTMFLTAHERKKKQIEICWATIVCRFYLFILK